MSHLATPAFYDATLERVRSLLPPVTLIALEGICATAEDRLKQNEEIHRIHTDVNLQRHVLSRIPEKKVQEELCWDLCIPFPLPEGLVLQETYWKSRIACEFGTLVCIADATTQDLQGHTRASATTMRELFLQRVLENWIEHASRDGTEHCLVPWGYYHTDRISSFVQNNLGFEPKDGLTLPHLAFGVPQKVNESIRAAFMPKAMNDF